MTSSAGILRTVDPTDGLVYVWTSLECDDARRLWACFDQPDLKAPAPLHGHRPRVVDRDSATCGPRRSAEPDAGARTWSFPDTPPLSPYVTVVNAGPFHEVREQRRRPRPRALLPAVAACRNLERDAPLAAAT